MRTRKSRVPGGEWQVGDSLCSNYSIPEMMCVVVGGGMILMIHVFPPCPDTKGTRNLLSKRA